MDEVDRYYAQQEIEKWENTSSMVDGKPVHFTPEFTPSYKTLETLDEEINKSLAESNFTTEGKVRQWSRNGYEWVEEETGQTDEKLTKVYNAMMNQLSVDPRFRDRFDRESGKLSAELKQVMETNPNLTPKDLVNSKFSALLMPETDDKGNIVDYKIGNADTYAYRRADAKVATRIEELRGLVPTRKAYRNHMAEMQLKWGREDRKEQARKYQDIVVTNTSLQDIGLVPVDELKEGLKLTETELGNLGALQRHYS